MTTTEIPVNFRLENLLREIDRPKRRSILAGIGITIFNVSLKRDVKIDRLVFMFIEHVNVRKDDREEIIFYAEKFKKARESAYIITGYSSMESLDSINGEDNVLGKELAKNIEDNMKQFVEASMLTKEVMRKPVDEMLNDIEEAGESDGSN